MAHAQPSWAPWAVLDMSLVPGGAAFQLSIVGRSSPSKCPQPGRSVMPTGGFKTTHLLAHANHHARVAWAAHNAGEHRTGCIISGKAGLRKTERRTELGTALHVGGGVALAKEAGSSSRLP